MSNLINRAVFFAGWLLSPLTFWNDLFVNIPVAYIAASILARFIHVDFALLTLVCYWASNIVGLVMMYFSGKSIGTKGIGIGREILTFVATIAVYSMILVALTMIGLLKPL